MKRLIVVLAVLVGGLTAVPGTAFAHFFSVAPAGSAADRHVSHGEACYVVYAQMNYTGYHGGFLRCGDVLSFQSGGSYTYIKIGVRAKDNALLFAWVKVPSSQYTVDMGHQ